MNREFLAEQIRNLLRTHGPIKARQLAFIMSEEFGHHVDRSDVNSILYRLKAEGAARVSGTHEWRSAGACQPFDAVTTPSEPALNLSEEQQAVVDLAPSGHLLIRGQAGSGKTTVLAARSGKLLSAMSSGSLLFLTYNAALCSYVRAALKTLGGSHAVDVRTFHDWSKNAASVITGENFAWVDNRKRAEILKDLIARAATERGPSRLYDLSADETLIGWWGDEIAWIFGQHITRLEEYLNAERVGRGTARRISSEERTDVWHVFESYLEWLEENHSEDYDNPAGMILNSLERTQSQLTESLRADHVMVDEVQDFDRSWLLAVARIPRVSLTLAGDLAQKIYKRNFSWSSVGIEVRGSRSRRLSASHRTTVEIMEVAKGLLEGNEVTLDADYTEPVMPVKHGPRVGLLLGANPKDAYDRGYDWIAATFKRMRVKSVAVAVPFSRQTFPAQKALQARGLKAAAAKGHSLGKKTAGTVVTTYHQLKGLEFDHVVLMGLHDGQFPGRLLAGLTEEEAAEEAQLLRRLIYMAMTRAKESVTLIGSEPFCRFFDGIDPALMERIRSVGSPTSTC